MMTLLVSGPHALLEKYELSQDRLATIPNDSAIFKDINKKLKQRVNYVQHKWQRDGTYLVTCTESGSIVIKRRLKKGIFQHFRPTRSKMVGVAIIHHGIIAASEDGIVFFYEWDDYNDKYKLMRQWDLKVSLNVKDKYLH